MIVLVVSLAVVAIDFAALALALRRGFRHAPFTPDAPSGSEN